MLDAPITGDTVLNAIQLTQNERALLLDGLKMLYDGLEKQQDKQLKEIVSLDVDLNAKVDEIKKTLALRSDSINRLAAILNRLSALKQASALTQLQEKPKRKAKEASNG
jgi:hypothetical protein